MTIEATFFLKMDTHMQINFRGPFDLVSETTDVLESCSMRHGTGIYVWAIKLSTEDYRITYIGETGTSFYQRMKDHIIQTLGGNYRVYDSSLLRLGIEKIIWHGLWRKGTRNRLPLFLQNYAPLAEQIKNSLFEQKIFIAEIDCETRLRKRIEGAIACEVRNKCANLTFLPEDIRYFSRKPEELPITLSIVSECTIEGLPEHVNA